MQKRIICGLAAVYLMAFTACGKKDEKPVEGPLEDGGRISVGRYRYTVNGCDTGEHVYNTHDQYCAMILDDNLNHHCAGVLRKKFHAEQCSAGARGDSVVGAANGNGSLDGSPADSTRPRSEGSAQMLMIVGRLAPGLRAQQFEARGSVQTTLTGTFTTALETEHRIELNTSSKIDFVGMPSECILSVKNFSSIGKGPMTVQFTLSGIDSRAAIRSGRGCVAALQRMAQFGFQARFFDVYFITPTGGISRTNVELSVISVQ